MRDESPDLLPSPRILLGPGPSMAGPRVRRRMLHDFGSEIGAAFGPLEGKIWRIGTMGDSAQRQNVLLCLAALEAVLRREGWEAEAGAGVQAALEHYRASGEAEGEVTESLGATGIGRY